MFFEQFYITKWIIINLSNRSNKFLFEQEKNYTRARKKIYMSKKKIIHEQEKNYILITKNYCLTKAFLALDGLPLFLFVPIATFFASGGGLQYFNLIDNPMMCLQM
jgi:hypothetical protein